MSADAQQNGVESSYVPVGEDAAPEAVSERVQAVSRTPLIAGNWKMNLDHLQAIALVQKLAWTLKDVRHDFTEVEVAVFPPFTDLRSVQTLLAADKLSICLGAQDVSPHEAGAYTGDVSAQFLTKLEAQYVIIGHSERRIGHREDDELIAAKVQAVATAGMVPVICVGEALGGLTELGGPTMPLAQLEAALAKLPEQAEFVLAYEPVWAIGSGKAASAEQAEQVCAVLRARIAELRGEDIAAATRLLYGGSVSSQNIAEFMRQPNIDGALVGGASLDAQEFARIVQFKKHVTAGA